MIDVLRAARRQMPELWGGQLCLDFADSAEPRGGTVGLGPADYPVRDYFGGYTDLVAWSVIAGTIGEDDGVHLLEVAATDRAGARAAFDRAIALREATYRVFWHVATASEPAAADLDLVVCERAAAATHLQLAPEAPGAPWSWRWRDDGEPLARPLWPVVESAVTLLTSGDVRRLKVCPGVAGAVVPCAGLFYDTTKNRSRQWCQMSDCGNSTKSRRQTQRRRSAREQR